MMMKLFINASLPTSSNALKRVNVLFDDKIRKISADEIISEEEVQIIDLKGKLLLPGGVEPHLHLFGKKSALPKTIQSFSKKAIGGGWTSLAEMSYQSEIPIFSTRDLRKMSEIINENSYADLALWAHVDISEYPYHAESAQELWGKGVVGIALMAPSPNPDIDELSFTEMMDLFLDIYESDTQFSFQGYDHETHTAYDVDSHTDGIKKILRRMQENPIHIPRVSFFSEIEFINNISRRSDISFALSFADLMHLLEPEIFDLSWGSDFAEHASTLKDLLKTNKIYLLSNSCGYQTTDEEIFHGVGEDLLAYSYHWVFSELWKKRKIPLATCIKLSSENAAKRLGIYPQKGRIGVDSDADFVIFNPEGTTQYTALNGKPLELTGQIESVYLRGEKYEPEEGPKGEFIIRSESPKRRHNRITWI